MNLRKFGIDTVTVALDLPDALPMIDDGYRRELVGHGWTVADTLLPSEFGPVESRTARWQDPENDTLRLAVQNAGRTIRAEFSVPRMLSGSMNMMNTRLGTAEETLAVVDHLLAVRCRTMLPEFKKVEEVRFRRLDMAADIEAGGAYTGLIAAGSSFQIQRARKVARSTFPGETSRVTGKQLTVRTYDKARELENKTANVLKALNDAQRGAVMEEIASYREAGVARLEIAATPKGGLTREEVGAANLRWADLVEQGYGFDGEQGGVLYIGGLSKIRAEIDGRADLSSQSRSALLAFAVRYAELGEDGMQAAMSRATYYRHKRRFLDAGLRLDDVTSFHGELDFNPVLQDVRAAWKVSS